MRRHLAKAARRASLASAALLLSGCTTVFLGSRYPPLPRDAVPPVVAVTSFDNRSGFAGQWELGNGMADLLVSEMLRSGNFVVVERGQLDRVVDEIERQRHRLFRAEGRVDEGRLRNARYLVRGVVNDFSQVSRGAIWAVLRNVFTLGAGGAKARVALTLTVIDVETGEIVDSAQCAVTASAHEAYGSGQYKNVAFGGDAFFKTPLGSATAQAIRRGVRELVRSVPKARWQPMIAEVAEGRIILNGGLSRGFRPGRVYEVRGDSRRVTDPATGELLSVVEGPIVGTLRVTEVRGSLAYAAVLRGGGFERGQRLVPAPGRAAK